MSMQSYDMTLDVMGLNCPLPILRAKKVLAQMQSGQVLQVLATDKGAPDDFAAFCRQTGHELIDVYTGDEGRFEIIMKHR